MITVRSVYIKYTEYDSYAQLYICKSNFELIFCLK